VGDCDDADQPLVSIILPTEGDARTILDRLQNLLEMDYPVDRLEIVVGCNEQDDLTHELVATNNDPRVCAVRSSMKRGRNGIINECLARARGEIVVLTDCDVKFQRQTLSRIAAQFRTPHVGAVSDSRFQQRQQPVSHGTSRFCDGA
jgi:cellulose synthase/poly-beta-1,6-N-acetylglucosamine synthase-like glycosyltransferase